MVYSIRHHVIVLGCLDVDMHEFISGTTSHKRISRYNQYDSVLEPYQTISATASTYMVNILTDAASAGI